MTGQGDRSRLTVESEGESHSFLRGPVTIGRSQECEVTVGDPGVSREHLRITRQVDGWTVTDVSANGVYGSGGNRVSEYVLTDGDQIDLRLGRPEGVQIRLVATRLASASTEPPNDEVGVPDLERYVALRRADRRNYHIALLASAVVASLLIWSIQTYYVSVQLDGFNGIRPSNLIPGYVDSSEIVGFSFWLLVSLAVTSVIATVGVVGPGIYIDRVRYDIAHRARNVRYVVVGGDAPILAGLGLGLLFMAVAPAVRIVPFLMAIIAAVLLVPSTQFGREIRMRLGVSETPGTGTFALSVILVSALCGLVFPARILAALSLGVFAQAALVGRRRTGRVRARYLVHLALAIVVVLFGDAVAVLADDGGWSECVGGAGALGSLAEWWSCAGSETIRSNLRNGAVISGSIPPWVQSYFPHSCPEWWPPQALPPGPAVGPSSYLPKDFRSEDQINKDMKSDIEKQKDARDALDNLLDALKHSVTAEETERIKSEIERTERELTESERRIQQHRNRLERSRHQSNEARRQMQRDANRYGPRGHRRPTLQEMIRHNVRRKK